eukprot:jgi/Chlat1/339/Chrsp1S03190
MATDGRRHGGGGVVGGATFTTQAGVGLSLLPSSNATAGVSSAFSSGSPLRRFHPLAWLHAGGGAAAARTRFVPPLACIAAAATAVVKRERSSAGKEYETHTGLSFPMEYCTLEALDSKDVECQRLSGLGVRVKKQVIKKSIQEYAVGIYVDHAAALTALGETYSSLSRAAVTRSAWLAKEVLKCDDIEKSVRLVMCDKDIKASDIKNALMKSLRMRMHGGPASEGLLAEFGRQFDGVQLKRGTRVHFEWRKGHRLTTMVEDREIMTIPSRDLCHALFELYMGDDPLAPEAKQKFQEALAETLTRKAR